MKPRRAVMVAAAAAPLLTAAAAGAYCRTTSCDGTGLTETTADDCVADGRSCETVGRPLAWPLPCVTYSIQEDGSPLRLIDPTTLAGVVDRAFDRWTSSPCGDGQVSFTASATAWVSCAVREFNEGGGNANLIVFLDGAWPYEDPEGTALAQTSVLFDTETGEIIDADIEINSAEHPFTTSDTEVTNDLEAVMAHELGHFVGLSHSLEPGATMSSTYRSGSIQTRYLSDDDRAGICAIYPPGRSTEGCRYEPWGGLASQCGGNDDGGCALRPRRAGDGPGHAGAAALALAALAAVTRRRRAPQRSRPPRPATR